MQNKLTMINNRQKSTLKSVFVHIIPSMPLLWFLMFPQSMYANTKNITPIKSKKDIKFEVQYSELLNRKKPVLKLKKNKKIVLSMGALVNSNISETKIANWNKPEFQEPQIQESNYGGIGGVDNTIESNTDAQTGLPTDESGTYVLATAYSSTLDQCDGDPFTTASGSQVHWGTIATNDLPFGTLVKFPDFFGDQIFTVEDRMGTSGKVDIWFPSIEEAYRFGVQYLRMEIL